MESGPVSPLFFMIALGILIIGIVIWLVKSYSENKVDNTVENQKAIISTILFVIGGVPLLIYPGVIIADVMMFDSPFMTSADKNLTLLWCALTLSYPVTYLVALIIYKQRKKFLYAFAPLFHVGIVILLFSIWSALQKG